MASSTFSNLFLGRLCFLKIEDCCLIILGWELSPGLPTVTARAFLEMDSIWFFTYLLTEGRVP